MTSTTTSAPDGNPPKAPDLIAWHVMQKGKKSYWNKVGASWRHKDGKGMTLQLETVPINGRIVLRQPMAETSNEQGARS